MYTPEEKDAINFKNKDIDRMSQSDSEECGDGWPRKKKKCQAGKTKRNWSAGEVAKLGGKVALGAGAAALGVVEAVAAKNKKESPTARFFKNLFNKSE